MRRVHNNAAEHMMISTALAKPWQLERTLRRLDISDSLASEI